MPTKSSNIEFESANRASASHFPQIITVTEDPITTACRIKSDAKFIMRFLAKLANRCGASHLRRIHQSTNLSRAAFWFFSQYGDDVEEGNDWLTNSGNINNSIPYIQGLALARVYQLRNEVFQSDLTRDSPVSPNP